MTSSPSTIQQATVECALKTTFYTYNELCKKLRKVYHDIPTSEIPKILDSCLDSNDVKSADSNATIIFDQLQSTINQYKPSEISCFRTMMDINMKNEFIKRCIEANLSSKSYPCTASFIDGIYSVIAQKLAPQHTSQQKIPVHSDLSVGTIIEQKPAPKASVTAQEKIPVHSDISVGTGIEQQPAPKASVTAQEKMPVDSNVLVGTDAKDFAPVEEHEVPGENSYATNNHTNITIVLNLNIIFILNLKLALQVVSKDNFSLICTVNIGNGPSYEISENILLDTDSTFFSLPISPRLAIDFGDPIQCYTAELLSTPLYTDIEHVRDDYTGLDFVDSSMIFVQEVWDCCDSANECLIA